MTLDQFIIFTREGADTIMDAMIYLGTSGVRQGIECQYTTKEEFNKFCDKFDLVKAKLHSNLSGKTYEQALKEVRKS